MDRDYTKNLQARAYNNDTSGFSARYARGATADVSDEVRANNHAEPDKDALLIRLSESEFAALDLQLYLNTHPCDTKAIARYNQIATQSKMLRDEYEKHFGPILSYISMSDENYFSWIDEPWPWDKSFISQKPQNVGKR